MQRNKKPKQQKLFWICYFLQHSATIWGGIILQLLRSDAASASLKYVVCSATKLQEHAKLTRYVFTSTAHVIKVCQDLFYCRLVFIQRLRNWYVLYPVDNMWSNTAETDARFEHVCM